MAKVVIFVTYVKVCTKYKELIYDKPPNQLSSCGSYGEGFFYYFNETRGKAYPVPGFAHKVHAF